MNMRLFSSASEMLQCAGEFLSQREAENNLLLGVAGRLSKRPEDGALYCAVEDAGEVLAAGVQAKGWNLVLSRGVDDAIHRMVAEISAKPQAAGVPGVSGPAEATGFFAKRWNEISGQPVTQKGRLRIYEANQIAAPTNVSGSMSIATRDETNLIAEWMIEFSQIIGGAHPIGREEVEERLEAGHFYLWRDEGVIVSIAGWAGPTPNGVRINSVYTPPEFRNRGYASANVAALSQHLLDAGKKFVFLFTEVNNPTSNSIYQKIGYRPVCDFSDYRFG